MNNNEDLYAKGSMWRKWDLHIHSKYSDEPSAKLEVSEIFEKAIKAGIGVISITDHSNVDSLDEVWDKWENGEIEIDGNKKAIKECVEFFPGVELKINIGKRGVHVLAIFPKYLEGERIDKNYLQSNFLPKIKCSPKEIKKAGGIFKISVSFDDLVPIVNDFGGIIIAHAGLKVNGIEKEMKHPQNESPFELLNSLGPEKEKYLKDYIDICEISNSSSKNEKEAKFYLEKFHKPTVKFSDSHKDYNGDVYTWIKADPTIEGLRQITFEPELRVSRATQSPEFNINKISIDKLEITSASQFPIDNQSILFNRDLVSVIGGRGSGKSLLLSLLAQSNKQEYQLKSGHEEENAHIKYTLITKEHNFKHHSIEIQNSTSANLPILYLRQTELAIAAKDQEAIRLSFLKEIGIENINSNFSDVDTLANALTETLFDLIEEQEAMREAYFIERKEVDIFDFKTQLKSDLEAARDKRKKLSTQESQALVDKISMIIANGTKYRNWVDSDDTQDLQSKVSEINRAINLLNDANRNLGVASILPYPLYDTKKLETSYESNVKIMKVKLREMREALLGCKNELVKIGIKEDVTALTQALKEAQEDITNLESYQKKDQQYEEMIIDYKDDLRKLYASDSKLSITKSIETAKKRISEAFTRFLEDNSSEYFNSIFQNIQVKPFVYFDCKTLLSDLENCFYKGHAPDFKKDIFSGDVPTYEKYFEWILNSTGANILDRYPKENFKNGAFKTFSDILFVDWYKYIKVRPSIWGKFGNKEKALEDMSIGEQATLLLKLKLATEGQVNQIIII